MNIFSLIHPMFPTPNIKRTSEFYVSNLGFSSCEYLDSSQPHICLCSGKVEIILTDSSGKKVVPNRVLYGYEYDAYIIVSDHKRLQYEFECKGGVKIVKRVSVTDYDNKEFVVEGIDGRWLGFGLKIK